MMNYVIMSINLICYMVQCKRNLAPHCVTPHKTRARSGKTDSRAPDYCL